MPIYEYECSHCRYYLEVMQKITDARLKKCPSCSRNTLQRLISAPVFRLKGSGWYETDFKSDQERKRNLAAAEQEASASDGKAGKDATEGKEPKESGAKESGAKESGAKEATAKESGPKDAGTKEARSGTARTGRPASAQGPRKGARPAARPSATARTPARAAKPATRRPAARSKTARRRGRR
jgi:putative FmdB family regulatory protein